MMSAQREGRFSGASRRGGGSYAESGSWGGQMLNFGRLRGRRRIEVAQGRADLPSWLAFAKCSSCQMLLASGAVLLATRQASERE